MLPPPSIAVWSSAAWLTTTNEAVLEGEASPPASEPEALSASGATVVPADTVHTRSQEMVGQVYFIHAVYSLH